MFKKHNVQQQIDSLNTRIKPLEDKFSELKNNNSCGNILNKIVIPNIGNIFVVFFVFIATSNLVKISEVTNPIFKSIYTPDYIYKELVESEVNEQENTREIIDISKIVSRDTNAHKDILNITKKWNSQDYLDFVNTGKDKNNEEYGHLFYALKKEYDSRINTLVSNPQNKLENYIKFNRELSGHAINVTLQRLGVEGIPDKCGGSKIRQDDLKIIFVYSKHLKDDERVLGCPGVKRPNFIFVRLIGKHNITEAKIELVGINEKDKPDVPIVRLTDAVAEQLGWTEEKDIEEDGVLEIMYSTN